LKNVPEHKESQKIRSESGGGVRYTNARKKKFPECGADLCPSEKELLITIQLLLLLRNEKHAK